MAIMASSQSIDGFVRLSEYGIYVIFWLSILCQSTECFVNKQEKQRKGKKRNKSRLNNKMNMNKERFVNVSPVFSNIRFFRHKFTRNSSIIALLFIQAWPNIRWLIRFDCQLKYELRKFAFLLKKKHEND